MFGCQSPSHVDGRLFDDGVKCVWSQPTLRCSSQISSIGFFKNEIHTKITSAKIDIFAAAWYHEFYRGNTFSGRIDFHNTVSIVMLVGGTVKRSKAPSSTSLDLKWAEEASLPPNMMLIFQELMKKRSLKSFLYFSVMCG